MSVGRCCKTRFSASGKRGMSFAEVMMALGVLGVIVAILIPSIMNVVPHAKSSTAEANLEQLNRAVLRFNQANWELIHPVSGDSSDEEAIFRSLQYRAPATSNPAPGSPYIEQTLTFVDSDSDETYRASWNGRMFQLISPGTGGEGIDLSRMYEGGGTAVEFEEGYQPVGAP